MCIEVQYHTDCSYSIKDAIHVQYELTRKYERDAKAANSAGQTVPLITCKHAQAYIDQAVWFNHLWCLSTNDGDSALVSKIAAYLATRHLGSLSGVYDFSMMKAMLASGEIEGFIEGPPVFLGRRPPFFRMAPCRLSSSR